MPASPHSTNPSSGDHPLHLYRRNQDQTCLSQSPMHMLCSLSVVRTLSPSLTMHAPPPCMPCMASSSALKFRMGVKSSSADSLTSRVPIVGHVRKLVFLPQLVRHGEAVCVHKGPEPFPPCLSRSIQKGRSRLHARRGNHEVCRRIQDAAHSLDRRHQRKHCANANCV